MTGILKSCWMIMINQKTFFDSVFKSEWKGISKPIPFLCTMITLVFIIISFDAPLSKIYWSDILIELDNNEQNEFIYALDLNFTVNDILLVYLIDHVSRINTAYRSPFSTQIIDKVGSIEAEKIADYLSTQGYLKLANKFYKIGSQKYNLFQYVFIIIQIFLPLYVLFQARLLHRMLKCHRRSKSETFAVLAYYSSFLSLIDALMSFISWHFLLNEIYRYLLWVIPFLIVINIYRAFKYTHNVKLIRFIFSWVLINLVGMIIAAAFGFTFSILAIKVTGWHAIF